MTPPTHDHEGRGDVARNRLQGAVAEHGAVRQGDLPNGVDFIQ